MLFAGASGSGFPFGGGLGNYISNWLVSFLGLIGAGLTLLFLLAVLLIWIFDIDIIDDAFGRYAWAKPLIWFKTKLGGLFGKKGQEASVATVPDTAKTQEMTVLSDKTKPLKPLVDELLPPVEHGQQIPLEFDNAAKKKKNANGEELLLDIVQPARHERGNSNIVKTPFQ